MADLKEIKLSVARKNMNMNVHVVVGAIKVIGTLKKNMTALFLTLMLAYIFLMRIFSDSCNTFSRKISRGIIIIASITLIIFIKFEVLYLSNLTI